jgi:predicted RNA binding protein YcfA (HicA-like mRNA interferase family)
VPRLPRISAKDAIRVFESVGYEVVRQRGSHIRLRDPSGHRAPLSVPNHKELKTGLLRRLIRDAGMTPEEFIDALK